MDTYVKAKVNLVGIRNYKIESEYSFYDKKNVNKKLKVNKEKRRKLRI